MRARVCCLRVCSFLQVNVESVVKTWVYNKLIELSKVYVREKIQSELLKSLDEKTGILMETLNELTEEYWPLLLSIADTSSGTSARATGGREGKLGG